MTTEETGSSLQKELKQLQARVAHLENRLATQAAEQQEFLSVVSHDLQAPLRKIKAFGQRLTALVGPKLEGDPAHFLARMMVAADRQQQQLDGLLRLSRVVSRFSPQPNVQLENVIGEVCAVFVANERPISVTNELKELPGVYADPDQISTLFAELFENAIKYAGDSGAAQIRLHGEVLEGQKRVRVHVADHGIGFSKEASEAVFNVFQQLHPPETYPGIGIGLTYCRRVAECHGGTLTGAGEPGVGATFVLTLPVNPPGGA